MRGLLSRSGAALAALAVVAQGCGHDPFSPPKRSTPSPSAEVNRPSKAVYLAMVTPGPPTDDVQAWSLRAQREANNLQAIFRIMGPTPDESPSAQPDVVRKAVADGASALIVVPGDSTGLGKALAEAEAKGVPVVLLGRAIAAPDGSKPFTVVEHGDFDASARAIVAATLEDAKKAGRPADGTAIVMVDRATDSSSGRRVAALKAAAESSGFRKVVTVPFEPTRDDSAKVAVLEAVKANPEVSVVLADDSESMIGASKARVELQAKPAFFVGGYVDYGVPKASYLPPTRESCFVEGRFVDLASMAVRIAMARLRGEQVEGRTVLASKFARGLGLIASEADLVKKKLFSQGIPTAEKGTTPAEAPIAEPKP